MRHMNNSVKMDYVGTYFSKNIQSCIKHNRQRIESKKDFTCNDNLIAQNIGNKLKASPVDSTGNMTGKFS